MGTNIGGAFIGLVVLSMASGGCMPLPFASPPMKGSFNVGPAGGYASLAGRSEPEPAPSLSGRFGLHPLGAVRSLRNRFADVGLGYLFENTFTSLVDGPTAHGPYLEVAVHPWQAYDDATARLSRLAVFATGEALFSTRHGELLSGGAVMGIGFDWGQWVADPFLESDENTLDTVIGYAQVEATIGLQLSAGVRVQRDVPWWLVTIGFTFRLPASAGVAIVSLIR